MMRHRETSDLVLKAFYEVYNELGTGFLESLYEAAMAKALHDLSIDCRRQVDIPCHFRGLLIGAYKADLVVQDRVIVELKATPVLAGRHDAQLIHYLRATHYEVGLLLNFGPKPEFRRLILTNDRKRSLPPAR